METQTTEAGGRGDQPEPEGRGVTGGRGRGGERALAHAGWGGRRGAEAGFWCDACARGAGGGLQPRHGGRGRAAAPRQAAAPDGCPGAETRAMWTRGWDRDRVKGRPAPRGKRRPRRRPPRGRACGRQRPRAAVTPRPALSAIGPPPF